jgi:dipeptidyl aminopeptidase/acylaminoacyl peptidase
MAAAALIAAGPFALCPAAAGQTLPTLEDVLTLTDIGERTAQLSVSPDGRSVAFVERYRRIESNDYAHEVVVVSVDGEAPARRLADAGDIILASNDGRESGNAVLRTALWSPDNRWLAYLVQRGGRTELWRAPAQGGEPEMAADGPGDVRRFAWTPDRNALIYETLTPRRELQAAREQARLEGFHVDDRLEPRYALAPMPDAENGRQVWILENGVRRAADDAESRLVSGRSSSAAPAPLSEANAGIGPGGELVWIAPLDPATTAYRPPLTVRIRMRSEEAPIVCHRSECLGAVNDAWILANGDVLFLKTEGFARSLRALYLWRPSENRVTLVRRVEEELLGCTLARESLICLQESTLQPRRLVRIDLASGQARLLYDPNPGWSRFARPRVERIDVHDYRGEEAFGRLFHPMGSVTEAPRPLVIVQYRARGFLRGGTGGEYPIHAFLARGYCVLAVEKPDHESLWARLDLHTAMRITELQQVEHRAKLSALEALLDVLRRRGDIDMARIAITGLSDGAETVYWALSHSDHFAVAVTSTPPVDPIGWSLSSERHRNTMRAALGARGDWEDAPREWRRFWRTVSPARHVNRIETPILMQLAETEALQAFPFYERMRSQGRPIELYIYPEARHLKWRPRQILAAQRRALAWIEFWLSGAVADDPAEPGRAERWRALREAQRQQRSR